MAITITQQGGPMVSTGIYHATIFTWCNGQYGLMTQDFFVPPAGFVAGPTLGEMAKSVQQAVDAAMQAILSTEVNILGTKVNQLQPHVTGSVPLAGIASSTSTGSVSSHTVSKQTSLVITKLSLISGRTGRGRIYVPFPSIVDFVAGGEPESTYLTDVDTFYADLFGLTAVTSVAGSANLVTIIYHRKTGGFTTQVGYRINTRYGTQRRRGDYGKTNPNAIL